MFTSKQAMTAREVGSAHAKLTELLRHRDDWYDGTVASVDARLSAVDNALPLVKRAAASDDDMLLQAESLKAERRNLIALRNDLLEGGFVGARSIPRISQAGPPSRTARHFVATRLRHFLAENSDALGDPDEMDERAENFAEINTLQLPVVDSNSVVSHFRIAVNWAVRNHIAETRKRQVRESHRTAAVDEYPDEMLFG